MRRILVLLAVMSGLVLGLAGPATASHGPYNSGTATICNLSTNFQVGVYHVGDGHYSAPSGNYDRILPKAVVQSGGALGIYCSDSSFGWPHTAGLYVAPGYETDVYRRDTGQKAVTIKGGFSGGWWYPNTPGIGYDAKTCKYPSSGASTGCFF